VSKLSVSVERFEVRQPVLKICVRGVGVHVWPFNAWAGCVCEFQPWMAWPAAVTLTCM
jgi:hypothetical protein